MIFTTKLYSKMAFINKLQKKKKKCVYGQQILHDHATGIQNINKNGATMSEDQEKTKYKNLYKNIRENTKRS